MTYPTSGLTPQAQMLFNRITKNRRRLRPWTKREGVTCYRLYDRDIPEIPLVIDLYEGRLYLAQYARRELDARPEEEQARWLEEHVTAAVRASGVDESEVYLKRRERQRGRNQYTRLSSGGRRFVVHEGGHKLWVNLTDYLDTGLFLDHRTSRKRVGRVAKGTRFLNLFAYTGAFTVYAAAAGARSTVSVDLSRTYLRWLDDNLRLNSICGDHGTYRSEIFEFLRTWDGEPFDLVVVDPPTFSNSKSARGSFDVQRDHVGLLRAVFAVCAPRAKVFFSTNARTFRLDEAALLESGWCARDVTADTIPVDFRNKRIHRSFDLEEQPR